jgi:hypothetical protein
MNHFRAEYFCRLNANLAVYVARFEMARHVEMPAEKLGGWLSLLIGHVNELKLLFGEIGHKDGVGRLQSLELHLAGGNVDSSIAAADAVHARAAVEDELGKLKFLYVSEDRVEYCDDGPLFGQKVYERFESARGDIRSAGDCLVSECTTAAVFHLMRVAEIGLRALAYDRDVHVFKNAKTMFEIPLELATWDQLIIQLEDSEKAIQGFPQTMAREKQFAFYHGALMQYRAFKNVFRNNIMHTRDSYDRDEALSVYRKVKEFMQILASRVKENERTPMIWV